MKKVLMLLFVSIGFAGALLGMEAEVLEDNEQIVTLNEESFEILKDILDPEMIESLETAMPFDIPCTISVKSFELLLKLVKAIQQDNFSHQMKKFCSSTDATTYCGILVVADYFVSEKLIDKASEYVSKNLASMNEPFLQGLLKFQECHLHISVYDRDNDDTRFLFSLIAAKNGMTDFLKKTEHLELTRTNSFANIEGKHTIIEYAARNGHADCIKVLINKGNTFTGKALIGACEAGHANCAALLMDHSTFEEQQEALLCAAKKGNASCVELFIRTEIDVNCTDRRDHTPLFYAIQGNFKDCVALLLNAGADPLLKPCCECLLYEAAKHGFNSLVQILIKSDVNTASIEDYHKGSPAFVAAENGRSECLKLLLAAGADPNFTCKHGTILSAASRNGHTQCVELLIDFGAEVNCYNPDQCEVRIINEKICKVAKGIFLESRFGLDAKGEMQFGCKYGDTPLKKAARNAHVDSVKLLIAAGACVNAYGDAKRTPLFEAASRGHAECVRLLLEVGATVDSLDNCERTPLAEAVKRGRPECVSLLIKAGATLRPDLIFRGLPLIFYAVSGGHWRCLEELIKAKVDIDVRDRHYRTPLMVAIKEGHARCARILVSAGADAAAEDEEGDTPLTLITEEFKKRWNEEVPDEQDHGVDSFDGFQWEIIYCSGGGFRTVWQGPLRPGERN